MRLSNAAASNRRRQANRTIAGLPAPRSRSRKAGCSLPFLLARTQSERNREVADIDVPVASLSVAVATPPHSGCVPVLRTVTATGKKKSATWTFSPFQRFFPTVSEIASLRTWTGFSNATGSICCCVVVIQPVDTTPVINKTLNANMDRDVLYL